MTVHAEFPDSLLARVALVSRTDGSGNFDGAWWPRSRDFPREIPSLLRALLGWGEYTRATVDLALWPGIPRPFEVPGTGRVMHWGGFAVGQDPHRIVLFCVGDSRDLMVIPPETAPTAVARLMAAACAVDETRSASRLLEEIHL